MTSNYMILQEKILYVVNITYFYKNLNLHITLVNFITNSLNIFQLST